MRVIYSQQVLDVERLTPRQRRYVLQDLVSGIDRCEETSNRAVRDYLRFAHPSPESAHELVAGWRGVAPSLPPSA